jgi:deazaflavin-dependent oxidoreductase (nitroreductase family)
VSERQSGEFPARPPSRGRRWFWRGLSAVHSFFYRRGLGRTYGKLQQVLLTTTGRKTGKPITVALGAVPEDDGWVVIGSFGGADVHPNWWLNLVANPRATIQVNDRITQVRMQEITDPAERQRIWTKVVSANPGYANYEKRTSRVIPLGLLRPMTSE